MSIRLNNKIIAGGMGAGADRSTIDINNKGTLTAVGVQPKQGDTMYDWIGTLEEYERGRNDKTIPDNWVCWITDDAEFGPTISQEQVDSFLTKKQITNCLTEIPQGIKYSFSGSTLTIHAGSTAIIPNEFEEDGTTLKFDYWTTENDISLTVTGTKTDAFLCLKNTAYPTGWTSNTYSGTDTTTKSDTMCYRTDLNRIIYNNDTTQPNYSFPLLKFSYTDSVITGVSQVFNSIGYIGSTVWVDKGVKGLAPNGRNKDGSLKNKEVIKPKLSLCTTSATGNLFGGMTKASIFDGYRYIVSETQPDDNLTHTLWYQPSTNLLKWHTTAQSGWATTSDLVVYGYYDRTNGVISNFRPKTTFKALDYNDKSEVSVWGMPSDKYIDLTLGASGSAYTAPANGWFVISKRSTAANQFVHIGKKLGSQVWSSAANQDLHVYLPCKKGLEAVVNYTAGGSTNVFRFFYVEGEV